AEEVRPPRCPPRDAVLEALIGIANGRRSEATTPPAFSFFSATGTFRIVGRVESSRPDGAGSSGLEDSTRPTKHRRITPRSGARRPSSPPPPHYRPGRSPPPAPAPSRRTRLVAPRPASPRSARGPPLGR